METIRELSRTPRGVIYLLVAMLVVAPAAFAIGVLLAPAGAQEGNPSSPLPQPTPAPEDNPLYEYLDPDVPFHSIQVVYPTGTPEPDGGAGGASGASGSSSTLGSATKPTSGKWVYLARIQRYISLPDDVDHTGTALGRCRARLPTDTDYRCPDWPLQYYQRPGSGEVAIDQSGNYFGSEADKTFFPFFFETPPEGGQ